MPKSEQYDPTARTQAKSMFSPTLSTKSKGRPTCFGAKVPACGFKLFSRKRSNRPKPSRKALHATSRGQKKQRNFSKSPRNRVGFLKGMNDLSFVVTKFNLFFLRFVYDLFSRVSFYQVVFNYDLFSFSRNHFLHGFEIGSLRILVIQSEAFHLVGSFPIVRFICLRLRASSTPGNHPSSAKFICKFPK